MLGGDRNKIFDIFMVGLVATMLAFMNLNIIAVLGSVTLMVAAIWYLRLLGKTSPFFFPVYKRASREQTVYFRSSHISAPVKPTPNQQPQKEEC